jgi:hypothetical protein
MTTSSMNIKSRTPATVTPATLTIYLRNSDLKRPKLRSIDILKGAPGQATIGSIVDGIAWALVSQQQFDALDGSARVGESIALDHFFNSGTRTEEVRGVQCPRLSLSALVQALTQQQLEMQRSNEENHRQLLELVQQQLELQRGSEQRLLAQLQALRNDLAPLLNHPPRPTDVRELAPPGQKQKLGGGA